MNNNRPTRDEIEALTIQANNARRIHKSAYTPFVQNFEVFVKTLDGGMYDEQYLVSFHKYLSNVLEVIINNRIIEFENFNTINDRECKGHANFIAVLKNVQRILNKIYTGDVELSNISFGEFMSLKNFSSRMDLSEDL